MTSPESSGRKRKRPHGSSGVKRQKRSSVESRTVSVTRLSVPICEESAVIPEQDDSTAVSDTESNPPDSPEIPILPPIKEEPTALEDQRPRSLRVSLSLPEDIETGSPLEKVVKANQKRVSPPLSTPPKIKVEVSRASTLPTWEEISTAPPSTITTPVVSSPQPPTSLYTTPELSTTEIGATIDLPTAPMLATDETEKERETSDVDVEPLKTVSPMPFTATSLPLSPTNSDDVFELSPEPQERQTSPPQPPKVQPTTTAQTTITPPVSQFAVVTTSTVTQPKMEPAPVSVPTPTAVLQPPTKTAKPPPTSAMSTATPVGYGPTTVPPQQPTVIAKAITRPAPTQHPLQPTDVRPTSLPKVPMTTIRSQEVTPPEFTQGQGLSSRATSNVISTSPHAVIKGPAGPQVMIPTISTPKHPEPPPAAASPHNPLQSLVSSAMTSALASVMAGIGNGPQQSQVAEVSSQHVSRPITAIRASADADGDVIITGFEPRKHAIPPENAAKHTHTISGGPRGYSAPQGRPQELYQQRQSDSRARKVMARTVVGDSVLWCCWKV